MVLQAKYKFPQRTVAEQAAALVVSVYFGSKILRNDNQERQHGDQSLRPCADAM